MPMLGLGADTTGTITMTDDSKFTCEIVAQTGRWRGLARHGRPGRDGKCDSQR